jgi:putative SOS response-associated peptidase YedK
MCNAFNTARNPENIREAIFEAESKLVRRTDQAHVKISTGELVPMKWGFQRSGLGVVNNTRSDNLNSPMWKKAIENRRCLIPVLSYYEWSGPKGNKQTHLFQSPIMITFGSQAYGKKVRSSAPASPCSRLKQIPWSHRFTIGCRQL